MTPRARVASVTAAAALAAAGVVVAIVVAQREPVGVAVATTASLEPRGGPLPLALELALRDDPEARDLRRGAALLGEGDAAEAERVFARHDSLEARVALAVARWPDGTLDRLTQLAALFPRSAAVQLNLGLARLWAGAPGAEAAWSEAIDAEPDSPYAVRAADLLHPEAAPGLPVYVASFSAPAAIRELPPDRQLAALRRAARDGGTRDLLLLGIGLQRAGRPLSARAAYDRAAAAAPGDAEAQVAAAVGRFDKAAPVEAFSRLGPLTRRFPRAPVVRFHLGLLLLWTGQLEEAKRQLRLARSVEPGSAHAREAARYLARVATAEEG